MYHSWFVTSSDTDLTFLLLHLRKFTKCGNSSVFGFTLSSHLHDLLCICYIVALSKFCYVDNTLPHLIVGLDFRMPAEDPGVTFRK